MAPRVVDGIGPCEQTGGVSRGTVVAPRAGVAERDADLAPHELATTAAADGPQEIRAGGHSEDLQLPEEADHHRGQPETQERGQEANAQRRRHQHPRSAGRPNGGGGGVRP